MIVTDARSLKAGPTGLFLLPDHEEQTCQPAPDPEPFTEREHSALRARYDDRLLDQEERLVALMKARSCVALLEIELGDVNEDVEALAAKLDHMGKARAAWKRRVGHG